MVFQIFSKILITSRNICKRFYKTVQKNILLIRDYSGILRTRNTSVEEPQRMWTYR